MIKVEELRTRKEIRKFIKFAFDLYQDDPNWVAPLISEQMNLLCGKDNGLFSNGPHAFFVAYEDGVAQARVLTGSDNAFIARKGVRQGYFSLFDSRDNLPAAAALFRAVAEYQRGLGNTSVSGPNSATFNDFGMGALVEGFDGPPVLYNPYNKPYYEKLLLGCGFERYMDHYAYDFDVNGYNIGRINEIGVYAMERYRFRVVNCDLSDPRVPVDVQRVISEAVLSTQNRYDMPVPTLEEIQGEIRNLKPFYDKDFAYIAYAGDKPVGFLLAMPDYFQVLRRLRGRLFPLGIIRFLVYRRRIDGIRIIIQMVSPDYQNRAVTGAMYARLGEAVRRRGIRRVEGSTIVEDNMPSRLAAERGGGRRYRVYRQYLLET